MTRPRVMFVNHTSKIAGAELVLLDLVRPWRGASAFLFENGPLNGALQELGIEVTRSRFGGGLSKVRRDASLWSGVPLIGKLGATILEIGLAARRHDVVYANSQKAFVLAAFATAIVRRPLIWHLHDIIDDTHFGPAQRRLQIALANHLTTRVIVPSQAAAVAFIAAGGRPDLVRIVPNGVDLVRADKSSYELRKELGLPEGPLAGVFSRLAPWKGQHVVLQTLVKLPQLQCIIVGDSLFGEQDYVLKLREMADRLQLGERVRFLGHRGDVPRLMQAVDVIIHPSVAAEPFGRTLVEAMLAGVPLIATDTGAAFDILDGGKAGTLVRPNDFEELAVAVSNVLNAPAELSKQLVHAVTRARANYGVGKMLAAVSDIIVHVGMGARA
jgi:glycosyltransferase involved in cell wall biosynthesis